MCLRALAIVFCVFSSSTLSAAKCSYDTADSFLSRVVATGPASSAVPQAPRDGEAGETPVLVLRGKEVVLTFNAGPHVTYTGYILDILDRHCVKAVFFVSARAALANPEALREVAQRGHTIALEAEGGDVSETGIEKGFAAIAKSSGGPTASFLHITGAAQKLDIDDFIAVRRITRWPADLDTQDTEPGITPTQLANRTLLKIREMGKGVIEFHDTRMVTVDGLDSILTGLRLSGFKVVQPVSAESFVPKEEYLAKLSQRPQAPKTSRKLLGEARRRVLVSDRGDQDSRRTYRRRNNEN